MGEYRPQSDLAAGLIYVLLYGWISLPLLESPGSSSQKGKGSSHLMHFRFDAGTPVFFGTWASMHEGDASFSGEETNLPVTHSDPGEAEIGEMGKPSFGKGSEDGSLPLQPCLWSCSEPGAASSRGRAGLFCSVANKTLEIAYFEKSQETLATTALVCVRVWALL